MSDSIKQNPSIGQNLRLLRKQNKLTQEEVSLELQLYGFNTISREIVSQIERGKHALSVGLLLALKKIYKCSFDDLFANITS